MTTNAKGNSPNIIDEMRVVPAETMTEAEIQSASYVAFDPESGEDFVIGGKTIQMQFLTWGTERRMLEIIAPYLSYCLEGAAAGVLDEMIKSLLVSAHKDLTKLAILILTPQMDKLDIPPNENEAQRNEAVESWLENNAHFTEIADLVIKQIRLNKVADSLGKLWAPGALGLKALKMLSTLQSQLISRSPGS